MNKYQGIGGRVSTSRKAPLVPHAPIGRKTKTAADRDFDRWREVFDEEYPYMTTEEILRSKKPFHLLLIHDLAAEGQLHVAQEIQLLFRQEEKHGEQMRKTSRNKSLKDQREKLTNLANSLKEAHNHVKNDDLQAVVELRRRMAEDAMHDGDIWLSKHLLLSALTVCKKLEGSVEGQNETVARLEAEIHCLLAYLAKETNETIESAIANAIEHLTECRHISLDKPWQFKGNVLTVKLKRPVAIHGLRADEMGESEIYDVVEGSSVPIYLLATLCEHELLINLANQIMHSHRVPTDDDLSVAHELADHALNLAMEAQQPTAVSGGLLRFALVLRQSGAYEDAMSYFEQLQAHASKIKDPTTEAIAYHNIGLCYLGLHKSVSALQNFANQLDLSSSFKALDLEADAVYQIGHLLLEEGYSWEAEECYAVAHEIFKTMEHTHGQGQTAWAMLGVAAGSKLWDRFASICRQNTKTSYIIMLEWKFSRKSFNPTEKHNYQHELITKVFIPLAKKMMPQHLVLATPDPTDYEEIADSIRLSTDFGSDLEDEEEEDEEEEEEEGGEEEDTTFAIELNTFDEYAEQEWTDETETETEEGESLSSKNSDDRLLAQYEEYVLNRLSSANFLEEDAQGEGVGRLGGKYVISGLRQEEINIVAPDDMHWDSDSDEDVVEGLGGAGEYEEWEGELGWTRSKDYVPSKRLFAFEEEDGGRRRRGEEEWGGEDGWDPLQEQTQADESSHQSSTPTGSVMGITIPSIGSNSRLTVARAFSKGRSSSLQTVLTLGQEEMGEISYGEITHSETESAGTATATTFGATKASSLQSSMEVEEEEDTEPTLG